MFNLDEHLDTVLDIMPWSKSASQVRSIIDAIKLAQKQLNILESKLKTECKQIIGDLALNLKKEAPSLNLSVTESECKIGNKSKVVKIHIDQNIGKWVIESIGLFDIDQDLSKIINIIVEQFNDKYGDGKILVEGKISTTTKLAEWTKPKRGLNSRLSRVSR